MGFGSPARLSALRRVRDESTRKRRWQLALFADHATRNQVGVGVVVNGDDLGRLVRLAFELDIARGRSLAAAVAGADFFLRRRSGRARRTVIGSTGFGTFPRLLQFRQRLRLT